METFRINQETFQSAIGSVFANLKDKTWTLSKKIDCPFCGHNSYTTISNLIYRHIPGKKKKTLLNFD